MGLNCWWSGLFQKGQELERQPEAARYEEKKERQVLALGTGQSSARVPTFNTSIKSSINICFLELESWNQTQGWANRWELLVESERTLDRVPNLLVRRIKSLSLPFNILQSLVGVRRWGVVSGGQEPHRDTAERTLLSSWSPSPTGSLSSPRDEP